MVWLRNYCPFGTGFFPPCFIVSGNVVLCMNLIKQKVTPNCIICDPSAKVQIRFLLNIAFVIMFMIIQSFNKMKRLGYVIFKAKVK